jgi:hypothetical protein
MVDQHTPEDWRELESARIALERTTICHGKVSNLEKRVPEQWWKTVFSDALYLKTDGDVVEDPEITKEEIEEIVGTIPHLKDLLQNPRTSD